MHRSLWHLSALTLVAGAALLSARLRFSVVPLLILAGMVVGPHMPKLGIVDLRFIQSAPLIEFMGRLGILFLLFYLGLEFSLGRLIKAGRSIALGGISTSTTRAPFFSSTSTAARIAVASAGVTPSVA